MCRDERRSRWIFIETLFSLEKEKGCKYAHVEKKKRKKHNGMKALKPNTTYLCMSIYKLSFYKY